MNLLEISKQPTCIRIEGVGVTTDARGYHESILRAFQILTKVKELLAMNTPQSVILEMIEVMESIQYPEMNDYVIEVETSEQRIKRVLSTIPDMPTEGGQS